VVAVCVVIEDAAGAGSQDASGAGSKRASGTAASVAGTGPEEDGTAPEQDRAGPEERGTNTEDGGASPEQSSARQVERDWVQWGPGVPLRVLTTEYASIERPFVAFIDDLRRRKEEQIMVLIPVAVPERPQYRFLHNHIDVVLERALRDRTDVVIGRVQVPLHEEPEPEAARQDGQV
jgi:hypothetical protein